MVDGRTERVPATGLGWELVVLAVVMALAFWAAYRKRDRFDFLPDVLAHGAALAGRDRWDLAEAVYLHALDIYPRNAVARYNLAIAAERRGDRAAAREHAPYTRTLAR